VAVSRGCLRLCEPNGGPYLGVIRELEAQIRVEYSHFYLLDTAIVDLPEPRLTPARWVETGDNWAAFLSGGQDHYASVRLQLWDAQPAAVTGSWDLIQDGTFVATSGEILLWSPTIGPSEHKWHLAGPGSYKMRVHCRGRQAVAQAMDEIIAPHISLPRAIEQYLLQLWKPQDTRARA
jgi:hypothetical protein